MCQTIALPPILRGDDRERPRRPASSQWNSRVGRSQTRTGCSPGASSLVRAFIARRPPRRCLPERRTANRALLRTLAPASHAGRARPRVNEAENSHASIFHAGADGSGWARRPARLHCPPPRSSPSPKTRSSTARPRFTVMATHFGRVAAMANGRVPFDAKAAADNAELATIDVEAAVRRLRRRHATRARPRPSRRSGPRWTSSTPRPRRCRKRWSSSTSRPRPATSTRSRRRSARPARACKACHDSYRKE